MGMTATLRAQTALSSTKVWIYETLHRGSVMANNRNVIYAAVAGPFLAVAGPILIGAADGISSLLLGEKPAAEAGGSDISLAFDLLLWVGAPIVLMATLPLFGGILKIFNKS